MTDRPVFASWRSFMEFKSEVSTRRRFMPSDESRAFLDTLAATAKDRVRRLAAEKRLYRAQVAHHDVEEPEVGPIAGPALPWRMMPRSDAASDGRANPEGIPRLYMADNRHTALAEVRPWIGSLVSIAVLETSRDLAIVDCRVEGDERFPFKLLDRVATPEEAEEEVWRQVSRAFREPVTRGDDRAGYAATQIIAELFERQGYDGVAYGSGFGKDTTNFALFDVTVAKPIYCEIQEVRDVRFEFTETGRPYYVQQDEEGKTVLVRNVITAVGPVGGPMINLRTGEPEED